MTLAQRLVEELLEETPKFETLKDHRAQLSPEEREEVMKAGAVWHHGPGGEASPAVWKAEHEGKTWYVTNTHRACQIKPTLKDAIASFHNFIKDTA